MNQKPASFSRGRLIAGIHATKVLDALRLGAQAEPFTFHLIRDVCKIGERRARELVKELVRTKHLEPTDPLRRRDRGHWYVLTPKGKKLANASAMSRLPRAKAERLLADLMRRIEEVNASTEYLLTISAIGAIWFLYLLHYNLSIAVWVGLIALLGVDAETAVFMLLYLDFAYHDALAKGHMTSWNDLREAIVFGAVKRLRPKVMTVCCMLFGLLPIMWSVGSGADVMKRIAAPMIGGILTSFLMELIIYPPVFAIWKWNFEVKPGLNKGGKQQQPEPQPEPVKEPELTHA